MLMASKVIPFVWIFRYSIGCIGITVVQEILQSVTVPIIIIIIMSLFYEDDIFSKQCTNLTYGPL